jgi:hypothetical protein
VSETPDTSSVQAKTGPSPVAQDWTGAMAMPARLVHPERLIACYDDAISLDVAVQLQSSDRVQRQLAILLMDHFGLPNLPDPADLDQADLSLVAAPAEQISALVPLAGAVFWAHVLASEIRASEVAEIKRRIGDGAFQTALANRDLSSNLPGPDNLDTLQAAVDGDGYRCLTSWHHALPSGAGAWARLKHANDKFFVPFPEPRERVLGASIMRRLALSLTLQPAPGEAQ